MTNYDTNMFQTPLIRKKQQEHQSMKFVLRFFCSIILAALIGFYSVADLHAQNRNSQAAQSSQPQVGLLDNGNDNGDATAPIRPPKPNLRAVIGDGSVVLYWDDVAESHYDPFFEDYVVYERLVGGNFFEPVFANPENFQGYVVIRSRDPEFKDAFTITDNLGNPQNYRPEITFDLQNEIREYHPASVNGQRIWLGSDSGISRIWEDTGLNNGVTYYYAVLSFTHGDALPEFDLPVEFGDEGEPIIPIPNTIYTKPPLFSELDIDVLDDGTVITGVNVVAVTPQRTAPGYVEPLNPELSHVSGTGSGDLFVDIIDPDQLRGGNNYQVVFEDTLVDGTGGTRDLITKSVSLINTTTGEILLDRVENFQGVEFPVKEGFLFSIDNVAERVAPDNERSEWVTDQSASIHNFQLGVSGRNPTPSDYRLEFFDEPVRESTEFVISGSTVPSELTNVIIYNETTGQEVDYAFRTNPQLPRDLRGAAFLNDQEAVLVGAAGQIQKTDNAGEEWRIVESGQTVRLKAVHFIDENRGWAAGRDGVVIRTTDGGETWSDALNTGSERILRDIYFADANHGWAVGDNGRILLTTNGGDSWQQSESGTIRRLNGVYFPEDNQTGYVVGLLSVLKTTDGGLTWSELNTGVGAEFFGIYFTDTDTGWITGTGGRIVQTTDGGATWFANTSNTTSTLNSITFSTANASFGWAVGLNGTIVHTQDAGETWTVQTSGTQAQLFGLSVTGTDDIIVVGANTTRLRSSDGGQNWIETVNFRRFRAAFDDNNQPRSDIIYILEDVAGDGELRDTWRVSMLPRTASSSFGLTVDPVGGDELRFFTIKPFTSADEFQFSIEGVNQPSVDPSTVEDPLSDIRVVPNPYLVTHIAESSAARQLHFTNLPQQCTIRIFNVSGQLVQTLNVNNSASESRYVWDMRSKDNKDISYGVYIYHVTAPGIGEKTGKFAVIK